MNVEGGALRRIKNATEAELREVAKGSGVPLATLQKIKYDVTRDPRYSTVMALVRYFARLDRKAPSSPLTADAT